MKIYILILLIFVFGCTPKRTGIDLFFDNLNNTLSKNEKEEIKNCPDIGCLTLFVISKSKDFFFKAYDSLSSDINHLLIDSFKIEKLHDRQIALVLAYQKKINNQVIDFFEIKNEIIQYDKFQQKTYFTEYKKEIQIQREIAKNNYEKFKMGDTLNLLYPLEKEGNHKNVYLNNFYSKKEYSDTLFLKCILIKKKMEDIELYEAPGEFYFWLKILEARNTELGLVDKKYVKGNVILLPVYDYGRPIER